MEKRGDTPNTKSHERELSINYYSNFIAGMFSGAIVVMAVDLSNNRYRVLILALSALVLFFVGLFFIKYLDKRMRARK